MGEKLTPVEFFKKMHRMTSSMDCAASLNDDELANELGNLGDDIESYKCSVIGEVLHRWRHPWKYRLEKLKKWFKS